ncbi:MAG TPA: serine hydrolase [Candidatus Acidoferrales bacterium]|nr:serine hydrolase [Candidatus Acidoferrales bacterium]
MKPHLRSWLLACLVWLICVHPLLAQNAPPADLDNYVTTVLKAFEVPGLSVAIVKDGRVVLAKGYGVRKLGSPTPVDENTLFGIGSNTKAFTAAALATLVDAGKLSWDDPVYERLPGFQMYDPYVSHEMTIRDLLTHRSGMGLGEGDLLFWPHTTFTREEIIYRLRFMKPASSFRSRYAYDNLLYLAAGQIIPAVTGKPWGDYVRGKILRPLGMNTTNLSNAEFKASDDYAWPHSKVDGKLQAVEFMNLDNAAPAGSINSSAAEMAKWIQLQLNRGRFPDREERLFSEKQSHEMWSAQTVIPIGTGPSPLAAKRPHFAAYGLGWFLSDYRGRKLVGHGGGVLGFVSRVMLVPEESLGVAILTNAEQGGAFDSILYHILDFYLGIAPSDWIAANKAANEQEGKKAAEVMKKEEEGRAADSKPSLPLEKYAGTYDDAWYGPATIRLESGKLIFSLDHTPKAVGDLQHWQYDTFKAHWRDRTIEDAFLSFTLKANGSIDHFTMAAVSPLADFSFDYQDLYFTPAKTEDKAKK